jgi:hypothetical protein
MPTVHNVAQGAVHMVEDGVNIHKRWFVPVFYRRGDLFNSDAGLGAVRKKRRCLNVVAGGTGIPPVTVVLLRARGQYKPIQVQVLNMISTCTWRPS